MITFTWDTVYESQPGGALARNMIDNELRKLRRGVREIMEREHNWGQYTEEDDGSHRPGRTTVLLSGNAATRDALTNVQSGALYFLDDAGVKELWIYGLTGWTKATSVEHADLENLLSDSHTQYLKKDLTDTMSGALNMGANEIVISEAPTAGHDGYLVYGNHEGIAHPTLGNGDAVLDDAITLSKLKLLQYSVQGTLAARGKVNIFVLGATFIFVPNFYASRTGVRICTVYGEYGTTFWGWSLYNTDFDNSATYRVNWEILSGTVTAE